jgi:hypothetical protein
MVFVSYLYCLGSIRSYLYSSAASVADNAFEIYTKWLPRFSFTIVSNALYSVDSFFLLKFKKFLKYIFIALNVIFIQIK